MSNDKRLARRASEGDERAFAAIFRRYHQDLYRYCLAILGNPEDAQDALQNTMLSALRALPGESRQIELKPWLYRIAHNESIDLLRRRRAGEALDPELAAAGPGLAREAEARERLGRLLADIGELPDRQRGALLMRELSGLGFEEIGAALGCSAAVARQTTYEARLGLREFEAGREMDCVAVTKALSDADGRVARRRDIRAHLRHCSDCAAFQAGIKSRSRDLAALSPLPALLGAGLLKGILGGAAGGGGGLAGSVALKATATVAVVAALGVGAERGGLIDPVLPGGGSGGAPAQTGDAAAAGSANATTTVPDGAASPQRSAGPAHGVRGTRTELAAARGVDADATGEQRGAANAPEESATSGPATRPELPAASAHGQQTAAAHKGESRGRSGEHPAHPVHPAKPPKPAKPEKPGPPAGAQGAPAAHGNANGKSKSAGEGAPAPEKPDPGTGNGKKQDEAPVE